MIHRQRTWLWLLTALLLAIVAPVRTQASSDFFWIQCRPGERSEDVRTLQYLLRARGHKMKADGIFGGQTVNAVKRFQRTKKLTVDGVVGRQTWKALIITVQRGSRGDAVRAAQNVLKYWYDEGYKVAYDEGYKVAVDGNFGSQTEKEVKRFQRDNKLKSDGVIGPATWYMLLVQKGD